MAFAKGKIYVTEDKLIELLGLERDIEIVTVNHKMGEGLELNIASRMPIGGLTSDRPNWDNMRKVPVPSEFKLVPAKSAKEKNLEYLPCECNKNNQRYTKLVEGKSGYVRDVFCANCHGMIYS